MVRVEIVDSLAKEIKKKFKGESHNIVELLRNLENNPKKGRELGNVAGIVIKEIRYEGFRFYFITDGFKLRCLDQDKLVDLLIRFVRMSDKKNQQKTIEEIKAILRIVGVEGFG